MTRYTANTDQILALVEKARAIGQQMEDRVAAVEREVDALHVEWDGEGARAHRENHDRWRRETADMHSALDGLASAARAARERYLANVEHNKRMWP